jgi:glycosyltransferase involved in cell wall biosynthesis
MRVAFDVSCLETPHPTGVERACRELLRALAAKPARHELFLLSRRPIELGFARPDSFHAVDFAAASPGRLWRERLVPPFLKRERIDLFHSPVGALPLRADCPRIATFHEVPWREAPERGEWKRRLWLAFAARRARWLIAVSERTRALLLEEAPRAAERIVVVPHGVEVRFAPGLPPADSGYLLFVGAARPRKNLPLLVRAWASRPEAWRSSHPLRLAGVTAADAEPLRALAASFGAAESLQFPGFVADAELPALYRGARALLFPSTFEGFGLPALEAMATGIPVVASSGGALPEVVGDAALVVAPDDEAAWSNAIERIVNDDALRATLRERGLARAATFRWERSADQVTALWEKST